MTVVFETSTDKKPASQKQSAGKVYNKAILNYVPALTRNMMITLPISPYMQQNPTLALNPFTIWLVKLAGLFYRLLELTRT